MVILIESQLPLMPHRPARPLAWTSKPDHSHQHEKQYGAIQKEFVGGNHIAVRKQGMVDHCVSLLATHAGCLQLIDVSRIRRIVDVDIFHHGRPVHG